VDTGLSHSSTQYLLCTSAQIFSDSLILEGCN